ncbi:MAG TPA: polyphosphate kinase 2 family protein [Sunxiuqinia sp.]|nr:polyphosphate kinase 2 family protein [Sunxiuqinia sp.]
MNAHKFDTNQFRVPANQKISLNDFDTTFCEGFKDKNEADEQLQKDIESLFKLQYKLYAENKRSLLIIFQAMDAAGKDGAIKHVFSGLNPQGCNVHSFKQPSSNELQHDYLWRHYNKLPNRGEIGIFNRSHYENVLITKVHPEFLLKENLPGLQSVSDVKKHFWKDRYRQINAFERTISESGTTVVKFFLHLSKDEQKKRFLSRIENKDKNWKFSSADIEERSYWKAYQKAYEKAISQTSNEIAPWYIIPADNKWFSHVAIGNILVETLKKMGIEMPTISDREKKALERAKQQLLKD